MPKKLLRQKINSKHTK